MGDLAEEARASKKGKDKEQKKDEKTDGKKVCSSCGHKTTKTVCKKCGANLEDTSDAAPPEQEADELQEAVRRLVEDVCGACDLTVPKLQPQMVEQKAGPAVV